MVVSLASGPVSRIITGHHTGVTQLAECRSPKSAVAGSIPAPGIGLATYPYQPFDNIEKLAQREKGHSKAGRRPRTPARIKAGGSVGANSPPSGCMYEARPAARPANAAVAQLEEIEAGRSRAKNAETLYAGSIPARSFEVTDHL